MDHYTYQGKEAVVCGECGYLDVPADHQYSHETFESWESALERFYDS
jgi:spore maturation protein CgeB